MDLIESLIMNISKNLLQNSTYQTLTAAALVMGLSFPVYAATSEVVVASEPATSVVSQTTKVVTTTTTMRGMAHHKAHHSKTKTTKMTEVKQETANPEARVVWKNGVVFHDVEPTAGSQNSPFGVPASTSDTLQGGVTSTLAPAPMQ